MSLYLSPSDLTRRKIWSLTWPMILATSATPLLGLVDTAVIGQTGKAEYLAAIAIGSTIFNFIFWSLNFLRMGTTGLTAQAYGNQDEYQIQTHLARALVIGGVIGLLIILMQIPIILFAVSFFDTSAEVMELVRTYLSIRLWAAPATLMTYVFVGWFIGLQRSGWSLALQIWLNGLNAVLDVYFVMSLGWGVEGIAYGTLIAELSTLLLGLILAFRLHYMRTGNSLPAQPSDIFHTQKLKHTLAINGDIFLRTLCLLMAFTWFTMQSATMGDVVLAANYILLQLITFSAFFLDGFAYATEALVGSAIGARNRQALSRSVFLSNELAGVTALLISAIFLLFGESMINLLTTAEDVRSVGHAYLPWVIASPILAVWTYQLDGIYIGATRSRDMRNMMIVSFALYLIAWAVLFPMFGNHGLWAALIFFFVIRAVTLALRYPALVRETIPV